jgi:hypothetical protein
MQSSQADASARVPVEEHLARCADCRATLGPATVAMSGSAAVSAVLFPEEIAGVPRGWVYTTGALATSTLALAVAVGYLLAQPGGVAASPAPRVRTHVAAAPPAEPAVAEAPVAATAPAAEPAPAVAPPAPTPPPESSPAPVATKAPPAGTQNSRPHARGAQPSSAPEPASPASAQEPARAAAPPAPAAPEPTPAKPRDEIDKLLVEAAGNVTAPPPVKEEKAPQADDASVLTRQQVMDAMSAIQPQVHECATLTGKTGIVDIKATIVPSGRVRTVRVAGMFAGTPAGDCVSKAVRGAQFPTFVGQPQPVNYPVPLR